MPTEHEVTELSESIGDVLHDELGEGVDLSLAMKRATERCRSFGECGE